jgi:hypothetical protein
MPAGGSVFRYHRAPAHAGVTQAVRNLLMDLADAEHVAQVRFLIRDRDAKYPELIDEILSGAKLATVERDSPPACAS